MSGKVVTGKYKLKSCLVCGKITQNIQFCSHACHNKSVADKIKSEIDNGQYRRKFGDKTLRKYLIIQRGHRCEKCFSVEWLGELIPLSVHHIDGDAYNNGPDNLLLLCLNCHGLTPNFGSKNRKSTRTYRYQASLVQR